ncbi:MAG TPA: histone deacetylase [Anaerolineales bacterium]|nr:histone deacetylase [Anaerolineales bacterium]
MHLYYSDHFSVPLPEGHRFPMEKYARLRERVQASGLVPAERLQVPEPASDEQLARAHHPEYIERVSQGRLGEKEVRRIGFPWSPQLVERSRRSVGGTIAACRAALKYRVSANLAGGTHHAYHDHGEGFCVFNDAAVAARAMQAEGRLQRLVILDCDVHQGNGTAAIFSGDPTVFTFSIHGAKNFPFHKEQSDLDIALPDGAGDGEYLAALEAGVCRSLELAQADLAIYLAGADPFSGDRLGRLALSKEGLAQRDRLVFSLCRRYGLPIAIVMSGGYARQVADTVDIHFQTIQIAVEFSNHDNL